MAANESRDRQIKTLKKILSAGKGKVPCFNKDTKAIFHYEVLLPPKQEISTSGNSENPDQERLKIFPDERSLYKCVDSTKLAWPKGYGKPLELVFGKKFQLPLFEDCLKTMLVDEISQFDVFDAREMLTFPMVSKKLRDISRAETDKEFAREFEHSQKHHCAASVKELGYPELDELLKEGPRPSRIVLHLLEVLQPDQYRVENWQMGEAERSLHVDQLRAEGNQFFSNKDFSAAVMKYREALTLLDQLLLNEKPGDEEWTELDKRNVPLYLNLSQCFLNTGQFYEAANCATEALQREPNNRKALFRRAKARMQTWDLKEAETDLHRLALIGEDSALVGATLKELRQKRKEKDGEQQRSYKAMFQGVVSNKEGEMGRSEKSEAERN